MLYSYDKRHIGIKARKYPPESWRKDWKKRRKIWKTWWCFSNLSPSLYRYLTAKV